MDVLFRQNQIDLSKYLVEQSNSAAVPDNLRKPGAFWGTWGKGFQWGLDITDETLNNTDTSPSPIAINTGTREWKSISVGHQFACGIARDGQLWGWGDNTYKTIKSTGTWYNTTTLISSGNWLKVSGGETSVLAIKYDISGGTLWGWGNNGTGQLGTGDTLAKASPFQVGSNTWWKDVTVRGYSSYGISTLKWLYAWGYNGNGELGLGDTTNRSSPVRVGTATNWEKVTAGTENFSNFAAGIRTGGTLYMWGSNTFGQLGQSNTTPYSSPVQIGSLTGWSDVACGAYHTAAIRNGALWTWGYNGYGQLGSGTTTSRSSPVQVGALTDWKAVFCGENTTYAIKTDGTLWAFGRNSYYNLGIGNANANSSPVQVGTLTTWIGVSACRSAGATVGYTVYP